jgi:hypothetical protein
MILFHIAGFEKGNDPETDEATLEGSGTALETRIGRAAVSGTFPRQFFPSGNGKEPFMFI